MGERWGQGTPGDHEKGDAIRVLVVQDHPLLGSVIAGILDAETDMSVCGIARSGAAAASVASRDKAGVVVMDFYLPDMSGPAAAGLIRAGDPKVAIVFHSADESETALLDAIDAGATAYLTKSATADQIVEAVRKAAGGEVLIPPALFAKAIARQCSPSGICATRWPASSRRGSSTSSRSWPRGWTRPSCRTVLVSRRTRSNGMSGT